MDSVLSFVREPLIISVLFLSAGIGIGVGHEPNDVRALWGSAGAVCIMSLCVAVLVPEATLAPSGVIVGFAATALWRDRMGRKSRRERDEKP